MRITWILVLAYLPYYLNDFANIWVTDYTTWVAIDYGVRLAILGFLLVMWRRGSVSADALMVRLPNVTDGLLWTTGTALAAMVYLWISEFVIPGWPKGSLGGVPIDPESPLFAFDASVGLVLVGISEEVVCRGLTLTVLLRRWGTTTSAVVSALLFSLMHWSLSVHTLTDAFVYGLLFVPATLVTRSIWPAVVVHFLVNYVLYSL
ncbi:CPBP family intramembrane glutamic endopeptidase [Pseudodesulfovibrio sp. zrk46]|uniref:CPBP family intramembrane glutamic endopeptidase n=1 Tax=Pseudodesulfovibrio sp. zrk46 TaxID=2725288 RepID=UPI001449DFC1|nr:CPBP family intramembrane glutamic endopeptidase [Pseudodesulfovibrio sp. zrk46]QJB56140.1 CPBP family intramembrane metalloprotease [Pseudodesulfovibrio sp. zrk46]